MCGTLSKSLACFFFEPAAAYPSDALRLPCNVRHVRLVACVVAASRASRAVFFLRGEIVCVLAK